MRFVTDIVIGGKNIECSLARKEWHGADVIVAELWHEDQFLDSKITDFRACVYLQWIGNKYTIIRKRKNEYDNPFWLELETLLSNLIIINE